jgi:hypothetical protein
MEEVMDEVRTNGKELLREEFTEFFTSNPDILAIRWSQYTPYFNDGSECVFGINDPSFRTSTTAEDAGDNEDGWDDVFAYPAESATKHQKAVNKFWKKIAGQSISEDVFKTVFNDHVKVTATPKGFDVEEYDHD